MSLDFIALKVPEKSRTYHYLNGNKLTITNVVKLCVRDSGTHRLETSDGLKWIVPTGWIAISIDTPEWTF